MFSNNHLNLSLLMFPVALTSETHRLQKIEDKKILAIRSELNELEASSSNYWHWRRKCGRVFFWECVDGKQRGISSDKNRIHMLARRDYLRLRLSDEKNRNHDRWCEKLKALLTSYLDIGLDIKQIILTQKQYKWAISPQSQSDVYPERLSYKTNGGVSVRSKSEQIIGNILEEFCIPYRYEPEIRIGNRVLHPDFVILTEDGRKIIIEHFGRMDLRDYVQNNIDRLSAYASAGYVIGENVFLSFEKTVRDRDTLMEFINRVLAA